jgi:hypothetical protein
MLHLISLLLKQVEAKTEGLRPLKMLVPADSHKQKKNGASTWRHKFQTLNNFRHSKMTLNPNHVLNLLPRYIPVFHPSV